MKPALLRAAGAILGVVLPLALFLGLVWVPPLEETRLSKAVFDAAHVPAFGCVALVALRVLKRRGRLVGSSPVRRYVAAFLLSGFLGAAAEALQLVGPRDADLGDVLRNLAGAGGFLVVAATLDDRLGWPARRGLAVGLRSASIGMLAATVAPMLALGKAYLERNRAFPLLCSFDAAWERRFLETERAELSVSQLPDKWRPDPANRAGRLTFRAGRLGGLELEEPYPDWTCCERLSLTVYWDSQAPVMLLVRVASGPGPEPSRVTRRVTIEPGVNRLSIPLAELASDLRRVRQLELYAERPAESFSVYVDDIQIEGRRVGAKGPG